MSLRALTRADAVIAGLVLVFAVLAIALHDAVDDLGDMGRSLSDAGTALQRSGKTTADQITTAFGDAADVAGGLPVIGGSLADRLRDTGDRSATALRSQAEATGRDLAASGIQGRDNASRVATIGALIAFIVPSALLLVPHVRRRQTQG